MDLAKIHFLGLLKELTDRGVLLSAEKDHNRLLELILRKAMALTNADGGPLYTRADENHLEFEIMITESLKIYTGGASGRGIQVFSLFPYAPGKKTPTPP